MRDYLLIYINGQRHELRGADAFQSLSDFVRHDLRLTGTKVTCAEGDCGSCTVFIGAPGAGDDAGAIHYRTVTACIQFLYQLDCAHVITVEGLRYDGRLNPVQEAMARCHGAQCGFCTPGFVVSLCALFEQKRKPDEQDVRSACVGNLCRCTGYDPIVRAGLDVDALAMRPLNGLYPPRPILDDLRRHAGEEVLIRSGDRAFFKPASVASAARFRGEHADCAIVAGGTDLGVQINKGLRDPGVILLVSGLEELRCIEREDDRLVVGAAATLSQLERACADALPEYARLLYWFGSPPIRSAATLGGNVANASPIGDTLPALFVLDAEIELTGPTWQRRVNINDFYTGYRRSVMQGDELITRLFIPLPEPGEQFKLYKVSKRKDLDIAAFTAAIRMKVRSNTIEQVRLAYGGVAPTVIRLPQTEAFLAGKPFTLETLTAAGRVARSEIRPISDVRGAAAYRAQLSENVLRKFYFDSIERLSAGDGWPDGNGDGWPQDTGDHPATSETRNAGG